MTHVITPSCIGPKDKDKSCTEVCPMDCIHGTANDEMLYIDPEECIDCGACVPACPRGAIFAEGDVPEKLHHFVQVNADYFKDKR